MGPRVAAAGDGLECSCAARAAHTRPCHSCTYPARTMSAVAKATRAAWIAPVRLGRSMVAQEVSGVRRRRHHDDLRVGGDAHPELALDEGDEALATGQLMETALQRRALGQELHPLSIETSELDSACHPVPPPPDHGGGDGHEREEHERDPRATAATARGFGATLHGPRSHTRSLALLARTFRSISPASGTIGRRVIGAPSA